MQMVELKMLQAKHRTNKRLSPNTKHQSNYHSHLPTTPSSKLPPWQLFRKLVYSTRPRTAISPLFEHPSTYHLAALSNLRKALGYNLRSSISCQRLQSSRIYPAAASTLLLSITYQETSGERVRLFAVMDPPLCLAASVPSELLQPVLVVRGDIVSS